MAVNGDRRRVLIAPDKFKGSLSAALVADHLATGLARREPRLKIECCPVADGGDGTVDAALAAGFERVTAVVDGPTGEPVTAAYARRNATAVIELAQASGLAQLTGGHKAPLTASSYGVGQLIGAALDAGVDTIILGLGGSACTDGGTGMVTALGARLLDRAGQPVRRGGGALQTIDSVDLTGLDPRIADVVVVMATDVDNPLLGPQGAARVYGPQKGATDADIELLEDGLRHWATLLESATDAKAADAPGAGAAGGVGFATLSLFKAQFERGIDAVMRLSGFHELLAGADLVITGEGSLDAQTLRGKAPLGVARAAALSGVPVVAVAGRTGLDPEELAAAGFRAVYSLESLEPDVDRSMREAGPLLERLADAIVDGWLVERVGG